MVGTAAKILFVMRVNERMTINAEALQIALAIVCLVPVFMVNMNEPPIQRIFYVDTTVLAGIIMFFAIGFANLLPPVDIAKNIILCPEVRTGKSKFFFNIISYSCFSEIVK